MAKKKSVAKNGNGDLEFADRLWSAANRLRGTVEAAEYKHIVLGLLFLKYLSDAFENRHKFLLRAVSDPANTEYYVKEAPAEYIASVAEDKDEYLAANVFWIPPQARWSYLLANAHQPHLGRLIDEAMAAIEKENPKQLRGVLPKIYARSSLPAQTLGELLNLFSAIDLANGNTVARDVLGVASL
ncbi:MAG: type I restriction-modification system subunit M N-terminal domain-containing protein [Desulfotomaculales bacterium]